MNVSTYDPVTGTYTDVTSTNPLPVVVKTGGSTQPISVADGADVALGTTTDPAAGTDAANVSLIALFKRLLTRLTTLLNGGLPAALDASGNLKAGVYGKSTTAGDLPVAVDSAGRPLIAGDGTVTDGAGNAVGFADKNAGAGTGRLVGVLPFLFSGGTTVSNRTREINTVKTAQTSALASGSALALWTPAAGKKFRLRRVRGRVSAAGRYELRDGAATVIGYLYLQANEWVTILDMEANGYLSAAANNVLNLYNVTGGAADLDMTAAGNEE